MREIIAENSVAWDLALAELRTWFRTRPSAQLPVQNAQYFADAGDLEFRGLPGGWVAIRISG